MTSLHLIHQAPPLTQHVSPPQDTVAERVTRHGLCSTPVQGSVKDCAPRRCGASDASRTLLHASATQSDPTRPSARPWAGWLLAGSADPCPYAICPMLAPLVVGGTERHSCITTAPCAASFAGADSSPNRRVQVLSASSRSLAPLPSQVFCLKKTLSQVFCLTSVSSLGVVGPDSSAAAPASFLVADSDRQAGFYLVSVFRRRPRVS